MQTTVIWSLWIGEFNMILFNENPRFKYNNITRKTIKKIIKRRNNHFSMIIFVTCFSNYMLYIYNNILKNFDYNYKQFY